MRAKSKPRRDQMISITRAPAPKHSVESAHVPDLTFPSGLRLGMMRTEELQAARNDREVRLLQAERLAGPLKKFATTEENQLRVELMAYTIELQKRALGDCQRWREQQSKE